MGRKYCIFAAQYFPNLGGVERYTYNIAKKLIEKGDQVIIVTSNVKKLAAYELVDNIPVYRMPCFNILNGRYPMVKLNREFQHNHKALRNENFDFIIVNTRFYLHSVYGQWFAKSQKIKCITIDHGTSHLSVHNKFWDTVGAIYEHVLTRVGHLFCDEYYGVSKACASWLEHFHIKAQGVLYNAIDLEEIQKLLNSTKTDYRRAYQIEKDAIIVTFTGRLLTEKGIPNLIKAIEEINKKNVNIYLFIAGDGDLESYVEERKSKNIIPLGRLEFKQVIDLLKVSDIFCLPSVSEGFSTSILEAVACDCYIITTERGGAKELLITEEYGTIISDNRVALLQKALEKAIQNKEVREKGRKLSYERLKSNFTWDIVSEKVRKL